MDSGTQGHRDTGTNTDKNTSHIWKVWPYVKPAWGKIVGHAPTAGGGESRSPQFQPPSRCSHIWHDCRYVGSVPIYGNIDHMWEGGRCVHTQRDRDTGTQGPLDKDRHRLTQSQTTTPTTTTKALVSTKHNMNVSSTFKP